MGEGVIVKSIAGFYYVKCGGETVECKARGRFRLDGASPLVGDRVSVSTDAQGRGRIDSIAPRTNFFVRPAVANIDVLIAVASEVNPVTDPFLIDRVTAIASHSGCRVVICINKTDISESRRLFDIYSRTPYSLIRTSAETMAGIDELRSTLRGSVCAFSGDSGVGKSSILNALCPELRAQVGEVSDKLGRGRHTTRCATLFDIGDGISLADTPGFASFDVDMMKPIPKEELQYAFPEFRPYIGRCRFPDCAHVREPDCAVTAAASAGEIAPSRLESYRRLYAVSAAYREWEK